MVVLGFGAAPRNRHGRKKGAAYAQNGFAGNLRFGSQTVLSFNHFFRIFPHAPFGKQSNGVELKQRGPMFAKLPYPFLIFFIWILGRLRGEVSETNEKYIERRKNLCIHLIKKDVGLGLAWSIQSPLGEEGARSAE